MVAHRRQRRIDHCVFWANLIYIVRSSFPIPTKGKNLFQSLLL